MLIPCSGCSKPLYVKDCTVVGVDHRTGAIVHTCRRCHLEAGARAGLILAYRRLDYETQEAPA